MPIRLSRYTLVERSDTDAIVYAGLSGATFQLAIEDADRLVADPERFVAASDLGAEFLRWYAVVDNDLDEVAILRRRYSGSLRDPEHLGLTVISSLGCNFDCPYCYESKTPSLLKPDVEEAVERYVLSHLRNLRSLQLHWLGGEPLLGVEQLLRLSWSLREACDRTMVSYFADITTNGFLLTRTTGQRLRSAGVTHAQVCLDGPPSTHNLMRPHVSGAGTFETVLHNVEEVVDLLDVTIRVNADTTNFSRCESLLDLLAGAGLAGKITVYLGQLIQVDDGDEHPSPSSTYVPKCFGSVEFAEREAEFLRAAAARGFNGAALPGPVTAPCTAVRPNEYVIGSDGELYRCWENVGKRHESVGSIHRLAEVDSARSAKWLDYDPFSDSECTSCVALPSCMGGCRHHQLDDDLAEERCSTFRHNHREQIQLYRDVIRGDVAPPNLSGPVPVAIRPRATTDAPR